MTSFVSRVFSGICESPFTINDANIMFEQSTSSDADLKKIPIAYPQSIESFRNYSHVVSVSFENQEGQDNSISKSKWSAVSNNGGLFEAVEVEGNDMCVSTVSIILGFDIEGEYIVELI